MTSQSLRKLQTTLWSMLRKTESVQQTLCRMSGIALGAVLLVMPVSADEPLTGRSRVSGLAPNAVFEQSDEAAAGSDEVRQAAAVSVESTDVFIERVYEETDVQSVRPDYSRMERVESEYTRRLNSVLDGADNFTSFESAGEWWSRRHSRATERRSRVREYVSGLMYEEMPQPDVDFYDQAPIVLSSTPVQQVSAQEAAPAEDDNDGLTASRRLKTDIRSIQPSLSYALKNIDKNQLPEDYDDVLDRGQYVARTPSPAVLQWAPSNFWHYPLYFEDPALERYGHTYHPIVQPFASTGRFATQLVGLPYQMALHPVCEKQYALGYYRPGEYAPKKMYQIPFNEEATLVQAAAIAGLILVIP